MPTIFSHIVQKRFPEVNEDIATDSLAYILNSSDAARTALMKLLRNIVQHIPSLRFRAQCIEGSLRPDMWGYADDGPRLYVENKFWAGLTDNQPIAYLKQLATKSQPSLLLVVAPTAREPMLWRELLRRLRDADVEYTPRPLVSGITRSVDTSLGPALALVSWTNLLSILEHDCADDLRARNDILQLRALCEAADSNAFTPFSAEELTDQRIPMFMLNLSTIVQASVERAVAHGFLSTKGLMPQASAERVGRYIRFGNAHETMRPGAWLGIHFRLWLQHGTTPLWVVFHNTEWGKARFVQPLLESWALRHHAIAANDEEDNFMISLNVPAGEEKDCVTDMIAAQLETMHQCMLTPHDGKQEGCDDSSGGR